MNAVYRSREIPAAQLPAELHPVLRRVYAARGVKDADALQLQLDCLLPYAQLSQIHAAAELLAAALAKRRHILIVGDYDADGATSTALAVRMLRAMGAARVSYLLPNRFEYGYGLSPEIVEVALQSSPDLIVTVDNGIASVRGVAAARAAGVDVLITDHHLPGDELPAANAIVNPNQHGDGFASKSLAGVGVIFYVMMALRALLRERGWFDQQGIAEPNLAEVLDLVALGTVADVVPLDFNNRILVEQGLRRIRSGRCQPGIAALIQVARRDARHLRAADLGFAVAPRLNAAGRLEDMSLGVECLLTDDDEQAMQLAQQLDAINQERKAISQEMEAEAHAILDELHLESDELPVAYCMYQPHWHQGVVGILAGRIKDRSHRPVIVFADSDDGTVKGSARSIPGFHMRDALDAVATKNPGLISRFGGHAMAAGLTLPRDNFPAFVEQFAGHAAEVLDEAQLQKIMLTDGDLAASEITLETAQQLDLAGPWGQGFPEPLFEGRFRIVGQRWVGAKQQHLKLRLERDGVVFDAMAFFALEYEGLGHGEQIKLLYRISVNRYQGQQSVQLLVEHLDMAGATSSHDETTGL